MNIETSNKGIKQDWFTTGQKVWFDVMDYDQRWCWPVYQTFDDLKGFVVAGFVWESEAVDYANYRNWLLHETKTTAIVGIETKGKSWLSELNK